MDRFVSRAVRGPLARAVSDVWWSTGSRLTGRELALPRGLPQLLVNLADHPGVAFAGTEGVLVAGPASRPAVLWRTDQANIVGASFRPGGLRALVGPVAGELGDAEVPLERLFCREDAQRLRGRLVGAPTPERCLDVLAAELLARATHPLDPRLAVALAGLAGGSVGATARQLGLSERRFSPWFVEQVGLGPKRYGRVRRFQRVLQPILTGGDLGEIAHAGGYCDQAHMNRDFRAFTGVSPTVYRSRGVVFPNHLPDEPEPPSTSAIVSG